MSSFSNFIEKASVIQAVQWFKNGDHPNDSSYWIDDDDGSHFMSEGKVVRYFRHPSPEFSGDKSCPKCFELYHDHGWIDTPDSGGEGVTVCPGDWIVSDDNHTVFSGIDFEDLFLSVEVTP